MTSNGRLPPEEGSDRRETLPKRVSDNSRRFVFRRRKKIFAETFRNKKSVFLHFRPFFEELRKNRRHQQLPRQFLALDRLI